MQKVLLLRPENSTIDIEGMKVKKRWIILMTAMTLIALAGLAVGEPTFECDWSVISAADVAWLITATIFVLMMTPGLSFFYGGMVGAKNVIIFPIILLTLCHKNLSFRYKSSKATKIIPSPCQVRRGDACLAKITVAA